jgi:hypothetical protein
VAIQIAVSLMSYAVLAQSATPLATVEIPIKIVFADGKPTQNSQQIILNVNLPALRRVVLSEEDVLGAALQIAIPTNSPAGTVSIYRLRQPATGDPLSRANFESSPAAVWPVSNFAKNPLEATSPATVELPAQSVAVREALRQTSASLAYLVIAQPAKTNERIRIDPAHSLVNVTIVSHPKTSLFTPPVKPRNGVFAENRDGHLYYGNERLRIWGCVRPQLPNPETADRIANMGFNAIRMWGPRSNDTPAGSNALNDDQTGNFKPSSPGDGSPLDDYDRFYARAKSDGLFIMSTGLTGLAHVSAKSEWLKGDGRGWEEWSKAIAAKPDPWIEDFMAAADERLFLAREQQMKNYLTHVNPYTGKDYAHEEAIAIYELANEDAHVKRTLERGFDAWPPFFVAELQHRWNDWLATRYQTDAALTSSWGKLDATEGLSAASIKLEPVVLHKGSYSAQRASDFSRFLIEIDSDLNTRLKAYARSFATAGKGVAVIPFSYDTQYQLSSSWLYDDTKTAEVANFGMYFWSLQDPLTKPPGMYVMDSNTVEGKITAIYETMDGLPDPYRSAYPFRLASLAGWQDWDAVFFHYWDGFQRRGKTVSDESYLTIPESYISPQFLWAGVYYDKDPVLLSSMAIAGQIFLHGDILPAPHPLTYVLGAKSIFGLTGLGATSLSRATYTQGARIRFDPASDSGTTVDGDAQPEFAAAPTGAVSMGQQVLWDWPNGRLIIDTPTAKAYVGKPHGNYRFKDGITVGGFKGEFVSWGISSMDGKPLAGPGASRKIYVSAANDAKNIGFHIRFNEATDAEPAGGAVGIGKLIDNNGQAPIVVDNVPWQLWFPTSLSGQFEGFDLARRTRITRTVSGGHISHDGSELYVASLNIADLGRPIPTPPTDAIATYVPLPSTNEAASNVANAFAIDLPSPLPNVSWTTPLTSIDAHLRATGVRLDSAIVAGNRLHIDNTDAVLQSYADIDVLSRDGRISSINVVFKAPPILATVIAGYDRQFGPAMQKHLAASEDQVSTVKWKQSRDKFTLTVTLTENQGTVSIAYNLEP